MSPHNRTCFGQENELRYTARNREGELVHASALIRELGEMIPVLRDDHAGYFGVNGRFYVDPAGHPEQCTAEASHPRDMVLAREAGQRWLWRAAEALRPKGIEVQLSRQNIDHASRDAECSWACHCSIGTSATDRQTADHMVPFLVSKIIIDGAGGISPVRGSIDPVFSISPRMELHTRTTGSNTQHARALVCTRSDMGRPGLQTRQHLTCFECLCSQKAEYLRFGTLAIAFKLLEAGVLQNHPLQLESPASSIFQFCADPTCTVRTRTIDGRTMSALEIQRHYLALAEANLSAPFMPVWSAEICAAWREVLDLIALGAPESVVGVLDWATRWQLLTDYANAHGGNWSGCIAPLLEIDVRFSDIGPAGLWNQMDVTDENGQDILPHRVVSDQEIQQAMHQPPAATRSRPRGENILRLAKELNAIDDYFCTWDGVHDCRNKRTLDMSDPWNEAPSWKAAGTAASIEDMIMGRRRRRVAAAAPAPSPFQDEIPF